MADQERPTYLIFLTDGLPTEGEVVSQKILDNFRLAAPNNLRLFPFGVGYDVDTFLLDTLGNTQVPLAELFRVSGDPTDQCLQWEGDLSGVHWIGAKMTSGQLWIHGSAGRHLGSEMSGGRIDVAGDAGDWVGAEFKGGLIHVRGAAGDLVGAAYRGSRRGMTGGTILIGGRAGNEVGHSVRRGLVAVGGAAGDLIGLNMLAGTVIVLGPTGIWHGAGIKRGTLGLLGLPQPPLLPSYRYACRSRPVFMTLLLSQLQQP